MKRKQDPRDVALDILAEIVMQYAQLSTKANDHFKVIKESSEAWIERLEVDRELFIKYYEQLKALSPIKSSKKISKVIKLAEFKRKKGSTKKPQV